MISGVGKFYVQIGSAIANQRRIQPITVIGREDENLACTGDRFKVVSLLCDIPSMWNQQQFRIQNSGTNGILWKLKWNTPILPSMVVIIMVVSHGIMLILPVSCWFSVGPLDTFSFADAVQGVQEA